MTNRRNLAILAASATLCSICAVLPPAHANGRLYVAPNGNDAWSGTRPDPDDAETDGPFATLERARDEIRKLKQENKFPTRGVIVELRGGMYCLDKTFKLTAEDSGTARAPVVYRAYKKETVRLVGGKPVTNLEPVRDPAILRRLPPEAKGKVLQADLRAQGITDFGALGCHRGWPPTIVAPLELFFDGKPTVLARWPNTGFATIGDLPDRKRSRRTWQYDGARPERWINEKDIWLHGYWNVDYFDWYREVEKLDVENRTLTVADYWNGEWQGVCKKGQRYYALNLLPELDRPGEWYLDRTTGMLYFWPPSPIEAGEAVVSTLTDLVHLTNTEYVVLDHLTIEVARGVAVKIRGGRHNIILGCTIRNTGQDGISVRYGRRNGVVGCDVYETGETGISLKGGNRKTLEPGGHYAENNHIHHYARRKRTYNPGIYMTGVGCRAAHNLIHDAPHCAIYLYADNDHLIEFNEIHSVCYESGDVGAFYSGRDWTARGTVIRHNFFHHIEAPGLYGAQGVYLDDHASGFSVLGNVFYKVTKAVFVGGGRDNIVQNNVFVDCVPAMHVDARGLWKKGGGGSRPNSELRVRLAAMPYKKPPWSTRYPKLVHILDENYSAPEGNVITRNICHGGKWNDIKKRARPYLRVENNLLDLDPLFVDAGKMDFRLERGSPAWRLGFKPIPFDKIGLFRHPHRASWPVQHRIRPLASQSREQQRPVFRVPRVRRRIYVDGNVSRAEWDEAVVGKPMRLRFGPRGEKLKPESQAWLRHDGQALYIGIENTVAATPALRVGSTWPRDDAVEVAIRNTGAGATAPIIVLRGYASGKFSSSDEAGAPTAVARRAARGVRYAARVLDSTHWSAEWRIPFASLDIDPAKHRRFAFNLTARKTATRQFMMWHGTRNTSWAVDSAGVIELEP